MAKQWYVVAPDDAGYHVDKATGYISDGVNGPTKFNKEDLKRYGVSGCKKVPVDE